MSVVIHGSEGTDSTLMVVSLVQVILDPDCRTIKGYYWPEMCFRLYININLCISRFESLIEREWIKAGHPFASRCAHLAYGKSKGGLVAEAPTFLLFLDCVWQVYCTTRDWNLVEYRWLFWDSPTVLLIIRIYSTVSDHDFWSCICFRIWHLLVQ